MYPNLSFSLLLGHKQVSLRKQTNRNKIIQTRGGGKEKSSETHIDSDTHIFAHNQSHQNVNHSIYTKNLQ